MIEYKTSKNFEEQQVRQLFSSVGWVAAKDSDRLVRALAQSDTVISAWDGPKLVGLVNAIDDGELTAYAHYLLILPAYQNRKIGSNLIATLKQVYKGYQSLILTAEHEKLLPFYQKMGFQVVQGAVPLITRSL